MAWPVKEQIIQAIVARLTQISLANGYKTEQVTVVRPRRTGEHYSPADRVIAVIQGEDAPTGLGTSGAPPALERRLGVQCDGVVRLSERSEVPMDQALNDLEADIIRAVMADPQFGGLAINTRIGPTVYPDGADGLEGVTVLFDVIYQVAEGDPYVNLAN